MNKLQNKLISIFLNQFDGKLELFNDKKNKVLFFKRGEIIFSKSTDDRHLFLQQILVQTKLTQGQILALESFNSIDEQQKYILQNNLLDTASMFDVRKKIVEENFLSAFFEEYLKISVHSEQETFNHKLTFSVDTLKLILNFVKKYIDLNSQIISPDQTLFLSNENKRLFSHLKLNTSFSKMIDRLNEKKYCLQDLEDLNIIKQNDDTFTFLNFMFFLGVLGKPDIKVAATNVIKKEEKNVNSELNPEDLKEKQIERLIKASPHTLISADKNLSEAILYKNTLKLIKRYDVFSQLNQAKYHEFYLKLVESLYILTSREESKSYYHCLANSEEYVLEKDLSTEAKLLYTEARLFFSENMLPEALEKIEIAIKKDASLIELSIFKYELVLYYCEKSQKNPSEKIETFLKMIIESDDEQVSARLVLAQYYRMVGDKKKQLAQMLEVLERNPDDILLKKKVALLKMQISKNKTMKSTSGIFNMEKGGKNQSFFANLFKKKDKK